MIAIEASPGAGSGVDPAAPWAGAFDLSGCFRAYASRRPGADLSNGARLPMIAPVLPGSRRRRRAVAPSGVGPGPAAGGGEVVA